MENLDEQKLRLIGDVERLLKAINTEIDWFIASFQEKDPKRKALARFMSDKKQEECIRLAKEVYERYK